MIPKAYSEGVTVWPGHLGPQMTYATECSFAATYRSCVSFEPKILPKYFVTTLKVSMEIGKCDELMFLERVDFVRGMSPVEFSESFTSATRKTENVTTTLTYNPYIKEKTYVSSVDFEPHQRMEVNIVTGDASSSDHATCNGDGLNMSNGITEECPTSEEIKNCNGCPPKNFTTHKWDQEMLREGKSFNFVSGCEITHSNNNHFQLITP